MVYWRQDFRTFLVYISLLHLFILELVESDCPRYFSCGDLGELEFPLSTHRQPECGLVKVDCDIRPFPKIFLENELVPTKEILRKISNNSLFISENESQRCNVFGYSSWPNSPSISFSIFPNISVFICGKSVTLPELPRYRNYEGCADFNVYYIIPNDAPPPPGCSSLILPFNTSSNSSDFFDLLSTGYELGWTVSDKCIDCHRKGGYCTTHPENEFRCENGNYTFLKADQGGKSKVKLIVLLTVIPGSILLCGVGFLIWCRRRRIKNSYLLRRNISFDPSLRSDVEGGSLYFGIPVFSYKELEVATNNFDTSKELGDGGFGTVYHGKLRDGREVAIKRLYEHNYKRVEQFMNEIKILTCLRHRNLVSLYGCTSRRSRELLLVYEYVRNGTVADHIHGEKVNEAPLSWPIRMNIAIETACALAYLHKSDIIHRDVKTNNILLDDNFCVKVADFGLSRLFPTDVTHISTAPQGTPGYVDPEYHQCYQLTSKSDVYSFGVVLIELISSMPAVDISRHRHEINLANLAISKIQQCAFDELIDLSLGFGSDADITRMTTSVAELAFRCLQLDKDMRPDMDEVLAFLKEVRGDEDSTFENKMATRDDDSGTKSVKIPNSPDTDDIILLKSKYLQSSPNAVTDMWMISSSTTSSSIG